jgi:hypothetical protein
VTIGFERAQLLGLLVGAREELAALDRAAARLYVRPLSDVRVQDPRDPAPPARPHYCHNDNYRLTDEGSTECCNH